MVDGVHLVYELGKSGKVLMNEEDVVTTEVGAVEVAATLVDLAG